MANSTQGEEEYTKSQIFRGGQLTTTGKYGSREPTLWSNDHKVKRKPRLGPEWENCPTLEGAGEFAGTLFDISRRSAVGSTLPALQADG
jgi:hypothetical protein